MKPVDLTDLEALLIEADDIGEEGMVLERQLAAQVVGEMLSDESALSWGAAGGGDVALRLTREAQSVRVRGNGAFVLRHDCVRCLREVRFNLPLEVDVVLKKGKAELPDDEIAVGQGDRYWEEESTELLASADVIPFDGRRIDIASLVREQIFLEVPSHPACDLDGAEPEEGACEVDPSGALQKERERWVDPRFQALASLRDKLPPGPESDSG
jgi:uncharacterized metal-binding protein YceD (DUF177 family)